MAHAAAPQPKLFGIMAQFDDPESLMAAVKRARAEGYTQMEAYTPYAVEELADELKNRDDRVPWIVFIGGMAGALLGFGLQYYVSVVDYPMNIGGRPDLSWPSFIPVTFECGVLAASLSGVVGMLMLNGLPRPYHPVFNAKSFDRASKDKFFLCIESGDPKFEENSVRSFLQGVGAEVVEDVTP